MVKVLNFNNGSISIHFFLNFWVLYSGRTSSWMEGEVSRLFSEARTSHDQWSYLTKYLWKEWSVWMSPHSKKVNELQIIQNEDGSIRQNHRWTVSWWSLSNGNHETMTVLEKYRLFTSVIWSWFAQYAYGWLCRHMESQ